MAKARARRQASQPVAVSTEAKTPLEDVRLYFLLYFLHHSHSHPCFLTFGVQIPDSLIPDSLIP